MGWTHGSRQAQTYVHLSGDQQKNTILRAYGLIKEDKTIDSNLRNCPGCGTEIPMECECCPFCYVEFPNKGIITLSKLMEGQFLEMEKFRQDIERKNTNVIINGVPFPNSGIKIDQSVVDLIVKEVLNRLKTQES